VLFEVSTRDWVVKLSPHPDELVVEVSSECDMNCLHSFRVRETLEIGVKKIVFSGRGESLAHPRIDSMVKMCKELGLSVALNTNGTLLHMFTDLVLRYVDELFASLDSASAKTYASLRLLPIFNTVIQSLEEVLRFKQLRCILKPRVVALCTVTKLNIEDIVAFLKMARDLGVNEVVFSFSIPL